MPILERPRRGLLTLAALAGMLGAPGCDATPDAGPAMPNADEPPEAAEARDTPPPPPRPGTDPEPAKDDGVAHALWELGRAHGELLEWHDEEASRLTLDGAGARDLQVVLLDGRCYRTVAVGGPGVEELDLLLYDPNGVLVRQDDTDGNHAVLGDDHPVCIDAPGAYRLQVRVARGAGDVAVRTMRSML